MLAVVAGLLLGGCGGAAPPRAATTPVSTPAPTTPLDPTSAPPADPVGPPPAAGSTASTSPGSGPFLVLRGDGLALVQDDGATVGLDFGAPASSLRSALEQVLGAATTTELAGCPEGARTALDVDGFTVLLAGDRFVGWAERGAPDRTLTTADGLGIGTRLSDLQSALPALQLVAAPDGEVWTAGGLSGRLGGADPGSVVTAMSAGESCPR